ncbi:MAG: hypothetical protein MJ090_00325 [Clostridia bacterium]|nr:hypothetical protein [Clostridia bacterium]
MTELNNKEKTMEELNEKNETAKEEPSSNDLRLKSLADKSGVTVEEFLEGLEERQAVLEKIEATNNQSVGSQSKNEQETFDPAGTEFLNGLWGK